MNDIELKSNELIESIKDSELYKRYILLKEKMLQDKEISTLIEQVKTLQKKAVKESNKGNDINSIEEDIKTKIDKLNSIPLYVDYDNTMKDLNDELQIIKNTIERCINDITK